ncbi:MAG: [Bacteroidales bacterium]|nr:[FeFe] hydrogenase H-cluster radical SAM maturase HydE [Bacteroidales bacterium]
MEALDKNGIIALLSTEGSEMESLLQRALEVKLSHVGNSVHLRGLIEYSNICRKNCLYCGLRSGNRKLERYCISEEEVLSSARLAHELGYGSVAIQSGERDDPEFV